MITNNELKDMITDEDEKKVTDRLKDFDFCLRKAIAVHVFNNRNDDTMSEFARVLGVTQSTLSKYMSRATDTRGRITTKQNSSRLAPKFYEILKASAYLSIPVTKMVDMVIKGEEKNPLIPLENLVKIKQLSSEMHKTFPEDTASKNVNNPQEYLKKIYRTGHTKYVGFFLQDDGIEHMIIETYKPNNDGYVPFTARIIGKAANAYRGNVVSPAGNDHLFFYIRQDEGKNDRGVMVFYIDDDIQDQYQCGSGILLSTDRKTGQIRLQWIIIIKMENNNKDIKDNDPMPVVQEIQQDARKYNLKDKKFENSEKIKRYDIMVRPLLEENLPESKSNLIFFYTLSSRQRKLYNIYRNNISNIAAAEERVKITEAEYQKALAELERLKNA